MPQLHQQAKLAVDLPSADALARKLAQNQVDPNEVAKCFTHLRALYERAGTNEAAQRAAVKDWWRWLEIVSGPGARAVVRSGRTQEYYRAIEDACRYHLRAVKDKPQQLVQALGWAVRLMRYYRNMPGALDRPLPFGGPAESSAPAPARKPEPAPDPPKPTAPEPPRPTAPELPAVGAVFAGKVLQVDESAVAIEVPGFAAPQVLGVIKAEDVGSRRYREGNAARVEVIGVRTLKSGRTIVELKPAAREERK